MTQRPLANRKVTSSVPMSVLPSEERVARSILIQAPPPSPSRPPQRLVPAPIRCSRKGPGEKGCRTQTHRHLRARFDFGFCHSKSW